MKRKPIRPKGKVKEAWDFDLSRRLRQFVIEVMERHLVAEHGKHATPPAEGKAKRFVVKVVGIDFIVYDRVIQDTIADFYNEKLAREYCDWLNSK
jgi:hypothetical protein